MMGGESETRSTLPNEIPAHDTTKEEHDVVPKPTDVSIRGGEHTSSTPDKEFKSEDKSSRTPAETEEEAESWNGWAEIENDPEIFTILVQEWGAEQVCVEEVLDVSELPVHRPESILGLIFLSRYVVPSATRPANPEVEQKKLQSVPWFANQISKFSCGSVSLMNILMNNKDSELSGALSKFKQDTQGLSAKDRGIYLDQHAQFRDVHNSFSTLLDRMIVDQMLKEDFQAAKSQSQTSKRKKGRKGRKRQAAKTDEDDSGNHFVAYIPTDTSVWRLDGMQAEPAYVGKTVEGMSWLDVASSALMQEIAEAIDADYEVSLMKVVRCQAIVSNDEVVKLERRRKQEDWAPFIEHMLRLHAEKGDLAQLLDM